MTPDQLLGEVSDTLATMPRYDQFEQHGPDTTTWMGRAAAAITRWDRTKIVELTLAKAKVRSMSSVENLEGYTMMRTMLSEAQSDLQMESGQTVIAIEAGRTFQYFEALRGFIQQAATDLLFVDPYINSEFVKTYLTFVQSGVSTRLLTSRAGKDGPVRVAQLVSSVRMFNAEFQRSVQVRIATFHDRFLFIDASECYFSGASFKDGGSKTPSIVAKVTDAFAEVRAIYEALWKSAEVLL